MIFRAARDAWGLDLQWLVHEDVSRAFSVYPRRWGLAAPDSNIDHRRVPNLETYWTRAGARLWRATSPVFGFGFPGPLLAGDILTWRTFLNGGPHVAIVSNAKGWPRIIQNSGWGVHEDWLAQQWLDAANAHFRWLPWREAAAKPLLRPRISCIYMGICRGERLWLRRRRFF